MNLFRISSMMVVVCVLALTACNNSTSTADKAAGETTPTPTAMANDNKAMTANKEETVPVGPTTEISFDETTHDFGKITDGDRVRHTFGFTNTGSEPLLLSNCKATCGCTVPQCPKEPIAPGEKGEITVEYNSKNKAKNHPDGKADSKFINITANTEPAVTRLTIKAFVMPDPNQAKDAVQ